MTSDVRFYFDYISPNAYLAWVRLRQLEARGLIELRPTPVLFAGLLKAHGQLGPAEISAKSRWMMRNNLRKAELLGLPLNPPAHHPFNPLAPLRMTLAPMPEADRCRLIDVLFEAIWVHGVHGGDALAVGAAVAAAGFASEDLLAAARHPDARQALTAATDNALAEGVFGVPTMIVDGELFWGYDDLPMVELRIAGRDPLDAEEAARWEAGVVPSAMRSEALRRGGSQ
jgi:2-hydroxychromene-2-carboxylate isomerase